MNTDQYYIHLYCIDTSKYGSTDELLLGPYDGIGMTWGHIRGFRKDDSIGPPEDHLVYVDHDVLRLAGHPDSFYSDMWICTESDIATDRYLSSLHRYDLPSKVPSTGRRSWADEVKHG